MNYQPDFIQDGKRFYQLREGREWLQYWLFAVFAFSIAEFEGFYKEGSISRRNLNPGNLRPVGSSQGFRSFSSESEGYAALANQIMINVSRGLTLREFFLGKKDVYAGYAPLGDNEPEVMENYISFVKNRMRIPDNLDLRIFFPNLITARGFEGYYYVM